ncbi:MAG: DUF58 domain-containing protein [Micrococcales bacterium]|nr:DUF58 domain-containing protein [Micrococcales bacterium]
MDSVRRLFADLAKRPVRTALAGAYASVFIGRSLDFEDLREYVPGDDVKAIDWKATARSPRVLVRRSVAERRHHLVLVVDTGQAMVATAPDGQAKSNLAGAMAGVFALLALAHGDLISAYWGDANQRWSLPPRGRAAHGDLLLKSLNLAWSNQPGASAIDQVMDKATKTSRRRGAAIVISDNTGLGPGSEQGLRQLQLLHEVMVVRVADLAPASPLAAGAVDLIDGLTFGEAIRGGQAAAEQALALDLVENRDMTGKLAAMGIATVRLAAMDEVLFKVIEILERHRHVAR